MAHSSDDLADHCGLHLISMRSPTFPSLCISTLRSSCSWGFWRNPEHHLLHQTEKVAALKSLMHWRAVKSLSCKGTAPHPAVPGWLRLGVPPKPSWGCLGVGELCNGQHTPGRWQRHPCVHGEWQEVQGEKTASGCKTKQYQKFLCSTGASQGLLHRSDQVTCTNTPQAAKHPPNTTRGIRTESSLKEKTNVTEKGGGPSKASPDTHALPVEGDTDEHRAAVPFAAPPSSSSCGNCWWTGYFASWPNFH